MRNFRCKRERTFVWLAALSLVLALASCSSKPESSILGKRSQIDGTEIMECFKDGTLPITDKGLNMGGSYKFVEENRIKVELRSGLASYLVF